MSPRRSFIALLVASLAAVAIAGSPAEAARQRGRRSPKKSVPADAHTGQQTAGTEIDAARSLIDMARPQLTGNAWHRGGDHLLVVDAPLGGAPGRLAELSYGIKQHGRARALEIGRLFPRGAVPFPSGAMRARLLGSLLEAHAALGATPLGPIELIRVTFFTGGEEGKTFTALGRTPTREAVLDAFASTEIARAAAERGFVIDPARTELAATTAFGEVGTMQLRPVEQSAAR